MAGTITFKYMNLYALQATDALKKIYKEFPQLYNNSIVCSFLPEVIYKVKFRICVVPNTGLVDGDNRNGPSNHKIDGR